MSGSGMGVLLLVLLVGGLIGGEVLVRLLPRGGYPKARYALRVLMVATAALYVGALLTVSLTSRERVLAKGETLRFCGFYLDCHLGVAVNGVQERSNIGERRAEGVFHVVEIRVSSDARRTTLRLGRPKFMVVDGRGQHYWRATEAERQLARLSGDSGALVRPVAAGESYVVRVVFDLPPDTQEPRLLVTDAAGVDRVLEAILIGDDNSIFHQPTTLALR